jgi:hypothetical protein
MEGGKRRKQNIISESNLIKELKKFNKQYGKFLL